MNFLKRIFGTKKPEATLTTDEFWTWFSGQAAAFHQIVKSRENVDDRFLEKLMPRLQSINPGFYCLTGMLDDDMAELIVTSDGVIKLFAFVEDFVQSAPAIQGWKFTALKPPADTKSFSLEYNGYAFNSDNIRFCYNQEDLYPDEIDISLIYENYNEENKDRVVQGCWLFIENSIGEMNMATMLDDVKVIPGCPNGMKAIPIYKLEEFITWREKELVEKYEGTYLSSDADTYSIMNATDADGLPVVASINQNILEWDAKASHPWMLVIEIPYDGEGRNGMPEKKTTDLMNQFEDELTAQLPHSAGYLHLGRETYNSKREIYFACKEFRIVSRAVARHIAQYQHRLAASYEIYKDRYWRSLDHFRRSNTM
jgi:hypothetical protein